MTLTHTCGHNASLAQAGTRPDHTGPCPACAKTLPQPNPLIPAGEIPRDRWGRPLVIPPEGGKAVPYTRCTTYVGCLEDTYNLEKWKMRQTAIGLSLRPDLQLAVVAHKDDKDRLNEIVDKAVEAAAASGPANIGTALHALSDQKDRGTLDLATVPKDYRADLQAHTDATRAAGLKVAAIEQFGVHDQIKVAGTWDRVYEHKGRRYIGDLKTGSVQYAWGKIAMQLAVYSRCLAYDVATGARSAIDVDQDRGIVVHLPAGEGKCTLYWVDLAAGWSAVHDLAGPVRAWRGRKNLSEAFEYARADTPVIAEDDQVLTQIRAATEVTVLRTLWVDNRARWTDAHTQAAAARKAQLTDAL